LGVAGLPSFERLIHRCGVPPSRIRRYRLRQWPAPAFVVPDGQAPLLDGT
jgi:hypothetical protein